MSDVVELNTQEQRFDEASVWIAKLDKGLSAADEESLRQWLASDENNRDLFLQMAKLWDKMDHLSRLSELFPEAPKKHSHSLRANFAVAASVLLVVFAGLWLAGTPALTGLLDDPNYVAASDYDKNYETAVGEQSTVTLSDGSSLVLNTNSLVKVKFTDQYRLILLERGEVFVDVAHDKSRPLSVLAADNVIQAVGTSFSVEITSDDQVELLVKDGKVLVAVQKPRSDDLERVLPGTLPVSSPAVSEGERLMLGGADDVVEKISPEALNVKLSWKQGNLVFRGESLEEAVAEISRYTEVEFIILNEDLKNVRIVGLFKAGDVDGLLAALHKNFNIKHQLMDGGKVLLSPE